MSHHPDLALQVAHEIQRSKLDVAARERLARSVRTPRRRFRAQRFSPRWRGDLPWRQGKLAVHVAR